MKKCSKCGKEVESGYIICEDCLKADKPANDMFTDLGYRLVFDNKDKRCALYRKGDFKIIVGRDGVSKEDFKSAFIPFITKAELEAALKKLEEIEL